MLVYNLVYIIVMSFILTRKRAGCFVLIVFWMSCYCKCHIDLPYSSMGCTAVRDCGIS